MTSCPTRPLPAATLFMILFPESFDEDPERCHAVAVRMEAAYPGLQFRRCRIGSSGPRTASP